MSIIDRGMAKVVKDCIISLDPDKIDFEDKEEVKEIIITLMNIVERLAQENIRLREENQQLRDEMAGLKS